MTDSGISVREAMNHADNMLFDEALLYLENLSVNKRYLKLYNRYLIEGRRLDEMLKFEKQVLKNTGTMPAGLDEAGRGPLAGPVVAAAVILPEGFKKYGLNDSKKMTEKRRNELYMHIIDNATAYYIKAIDNDEIDKINILNATKKAMLICVENLKIVPSYLLVDAIGIPGTEIKQAGIIKGDARSVSIAAASILAKVFRDSIMYEYDKVYPQYGFSRNKGYGTHEHLDALKKYGPAKIHRQSFIKNIV